MLSNIFFIGIFLWLVILTMVVFLTRRHYLRLTTRTKSGNIDTILENLIEKEDLSQKEIANFKQEIQGIILGNKRYIQRIGFLRFNAFDRAGGEQSFVISLLNEEDNGIVLTFLHTREGVRVLAKKVKQGVSQEYELSAEEKEAVKKAV